MRRTDFFSLWRQKVAEAETAERLAGLDPNRLPTREHVTPIQGRRGGGYTYRVQIWRTPPGGGSLERGGLTVRSRSLITPAEAIAHAQRLIGDDTEDRYPEGTVRAMFVDRIWGPE